MCNEDGSVWVVFNGEIYNHLELRKRLEESGHCFRSKTDTESLVHGYEQWGISVLKHLRGMFGFAIWDEGARRLFLARDRIGIKPLYYTIGAGRFAFASEIKSLLTLPWIESRVNREALEMYLSCSVVPAPETLFEGIFKLPAGHQMVLPEGGEPLIDAYWDPVFPGGENRNGNLAENAQRLRDHLEESIRLRMMSDVPFGVFLSGGIDSSLNVALMSRLMDRPVDTFSVAIRGDVKSNEFSDARKAADFFKANHREIEIDWKDFLSFLPKMAYFQDEPFADPVCVPLYYVARLARESGTIVIQVGEGSDELFCGYPDYAKRLQIYPYWKAYNTLPRGLKKGVAHALEGHVRLGVSTYLNLAAEGEPLFSGGAAGFGDREKAILLNGNMKLGRAADWVEGIYRKRRDAGLTTGLLDEMVYLELKHRLPELLLMRVDKMTMANSVEARVPFLDQELVRFAVGLPENQKFRKGQLKAILKRAARGLLPDDIIDRPKRGFCGSAGNMVTPPVIHTALALMRRSEGFGGLINSEYAEQLCRLSLSGKPQYGFRIWIILNLLLWHLVWIEGVSETSLTETVIRAGGEC